MNVLIVGSGAREHALAWKISQSPSVSRIIAAPGNAGIAEFASCESVSADDLDGLVELAARERVDLAVIGPEAPLVAGLADRLRARGIATFGPSQQAARLEGSKSYSKELMAARQIPTAGFAVFQDADAADAYIEQANRPLVIKADGLAAGKGVVVASTTDEALAAVDSMLRQHAFGDAGKTVVIEEVLRGPEISYHVICDGTRYVPLAAAQDHKRLLSGDRGPNTGGMGAYSPPPALTRELEAEICERVVEPTLAEMAERGAPFTGALFIGLMIVQGRPQVLEYNVRFGDPEATVLMARWRGDVLPLLLGAAQGDLSGVKPVWEAPAAMSVVLAASGYPAKPRRGDVIEGLGAAAAEGVRVFHAGTKLEHGQVLTNGGRVLAVTAIGQEIDEAAERAYRAVKAIRFDDMQYRDDIGWQARND